jgi:hypothetical protein
MERTLTNEEVDEMQVLTAASRFRLSVVVLAGQMTRHSLSAGIRLTWFATRRQMELCSKLVENLGVELR